MPLMDPTEVFRQEASELFETLEGALLDLGQRPDDRELVDSAFRALHTIKGSGAMFGFENVSSFTHEFETAFDLVRKGGHLIHLYCVFFSGDNDRNKLRREPSTRPRCQPRKNGAFVLRLTVRGIEY